MIAYNLITTQVSHVLVLNLGGLPPVLPNSCRRIDASEPFRIDEVEPYRARAGALGNWPLYEEYVIECDSEGGTTR